MSTPIKPLADRVVATREQAATKTASGLYLPNNAKEKPVYAVVQAVGPDVKTLKKGDKISLVGFGTFSVTKRAARTGRNPQTGKTIKIAAKKVVKFKAGATLSATVNK